MIELATPETARYVAENLSDREICVLDYGKEDAAELCFETARDSILSWVVVDRFGEPVCLFGADGDEGDDWGSAWMFSTGSIKKSPLETIKALRQAIDYSRSHWPQLRIISEQRSSKQARFLKLVGFRPGEEDETELIL